MPRDLWRHIPLYPISFIPLLFLTFLQLVRALRLCWPFWGVTRNLRPHSIPSLHGQWRTESCPSLVLMALSPGQLLLSEVANTLEFQPYRVEQEASIGMSVFGNPDHYFLVSQKKLWRASPSPMWQEERKNLYFRPAPWRPNSWAAPQGQYKWLPGQKRWLQVHLHSAPAAAGSLVVLLWRKARCTGKVWLFLTHSIF